MQTAEDLIRASDVALPVSKEALIAALIPRIGLTSYAWVAKALPLGASRFGGPADLPEGVEWPRRDGRPLLLLAQLNFGDLKLRRDHHSVVELLPRKGWLCVFMDLDGWQKSGKSQNVVLQFEGEADKLVRHDPEPSPDTEVWTQCHCVTVHPADHNFCLPDWDAVDSPLPEEVSEAGHDEYQDLVSEIRYLKRTHYEVTLLGSPTLFNPDLRRSLPKPEEWMLLLEFDGRCRWIAGVSREEDYVSAPSLGSTDYAQYFVRKEDFRAGRLDRGHLGYMLT